MFLSADKILRKNISRHYLNFTLCGLYTNMTVLYNSIHLFISIYTMLKSSDCNQLYILDLLSKVDPQLFLEKFGCGLDGAESLVRKGRYWLRPITRQQLDIPLLCH